MELTENFMDFCWSKSVSTVDILTHDLSISTFLPSVLDLSLNIQHVSLTDISAQLPEMTEYTDQ